MDIRLKAALASEDLNVAAFCREHGISRQTFYVWRRRYREQGLEGLTPRSRAPKSSPGRISFGIEEAIVKLRKELTDLGVDAGPATIRWHLGRQEQTPVPSEATIWRVLVRRGFVVPEPNKRPKSSYQRFEASAPNELWQTDCVDWDLASGTTVKIISFIDDHSRVALRVKALAEATSEATWAAFCDATAIWGVPIGQLSDNGLNFSGRVRGFEVYFERQLRGIGVQPKTSRPWHPQTCGKVERFQQTLKKWLRARPPATGLGDLQAQIDEFVNYYNHHRPHRGIGRTVPIQRWSASPPAINLGVALPSPAQHAYITVGPNGVAVTGPYRFGLGVKWAGHQVRVDYDHTNFAIFSGHTLLRVGTINPNQRYQPRNPRTTKPT